MIKLPFDVGVTHFVGIGGIGMSGIAEVMRGLGLPVSGSDLSESANVERLRRAGAEVFIGHHPENIDGAGAVVVSSAVKQANPEVVAAKERGIPVLRRADMLAELMRFSWCITIAGTHGKTTTTALVDAVLAGAGLEPTTVNGGVMNAYGSNARLGTGDWFIAEADESDGSFLSLPVTIGVITNIDPEHLEHYGGQEALEEAFGQFAAHIPYYGHLVINADHPGCQALRRAVANQHVVTFGFSEAADVRAGEIYFDAGIASFDVHLSDGAVETVSLPLPGRHNVLNALAAIAVAEILNIERGSLKRSLASFAGVQRRFTRCGELNGATIVDDYAHHPVEIEAVISAAREAFQGRVIAVIQPHRFTRLRDLFEEFAACAHGADQVIITEVYTAGETPIEGIDNHSLAARMREVTGAQVETAADFEDLATKLAATATPGDVVLCLGAGSISAWSRRLPDELGRVGQANRQGGPS